MAISCSILDLCQISVPQTSSTNTLVNILLDLVCDVHHLGGLWLADRERGRGVIWRSEVEDRYLSNSAQDNRGRQA